MCRASLSEKNTTEMTYIHSRYCITEYEVFVQPDLLVEEKQYVKKQYMFVCENHLKYEASANMYHLQYNIHT